MNNYLYNNYLYIVFHNSDDANVSNVLGETESAVGEQSPSTAVDAADITQDLEIVLRKSLQPVASVEFRPSKKFVHGKRVGETTFDKDFAIKRSKFLAIIESQKTVSNGTP